MYPAPSREADSSKESFQALPASLCRPAASSSAGCTSSHCSSFRRRSSAALPQPLRTRSLSALWLDCWVCSVRCQAFALQTCAASTMQGNSKPPARACPQLLTSSHVHQVREHSTGRVLEEVLESQHSLQNYNCSLIQWEDPLHGCAPNPVTQPTISMYTASSQAHVQLLFAMVHDVLLPAYICNLPCTCMESSHRQTGLAGHIHTPSRLHDVLLPAYICNLPCTCMESSHWQPGLAGHIHTPSRLHDVLLPAYICNLPCTCMESSHWQTGLAGHIHTPSRSHSPRRLARPLVRLHLGHAARARTGHHG